VQTLVVEMSAGPKKCIPRISNIPTQKNVMPGRAGGSRGSAPNAPYLNEARPATISSEGLSGRRGAPTGAKVLVVTYKIFLIFLTKI
jgi:hypothetical protein